MRAREQQARRRQGNVYGARLLSVLGISTRTDRETMTPNTNLRNVFLMASTPFMHLTAEKINSGHCFEWAMKVYDTIEGSKITWRQVDGALHHFIEIAGYYFDAECWDGVTDWQQLPFFRRVLGLRRWEYPTLESRWFEIEISKEATP
jgi:hypothetical protein